MRYTRIGGQAVLEGVMMRDGDDYAVAVRKPDRTIEVKKDKYIGLNSRFKTKNIPVIRGVFAFVDSLILGMSTLTYSAEFIEDDEDTSEKTETSGKKDSAMKDKIIMGLTVALSVAIAVALFMMAPFFISSIVGRFIKNELIITVLEGIIRIAFFLIYIIAISQMKDIQRVFMYHGAEHKTISCIEHGMELTPENAAGCSRLHKRCGTSFLFIVMIVSIFCFMLIHTETFASRMLLRLVLVPVIAGLSYEIIQWAGRSSSPLVEIVSKPGLMLQRLTTREPEKEMLEVAIASIEAIYDWRAFQTGESD